MTTEELIRLWKEEEAAAHIKDALSANNGPIILEK